MHDGGTCDQRPRYLGLTGMKQWEVEGLALSLTGHGSGLFRSFNDI